MLFISYLVLHFLRSVLSDLQLQLFEHGPWLIVLGKKDSVFVGLQCTEVKVLLAGHRLWVCWWRPWTFLTFPLADIHKGNICSLVIKTNHSDSTICTVKRLDTYQFTMKHSVFNVNTTCTNILFIFSKRNDDSVWNSTKMCLYLRLCVYILFLEPTFTVYITFFHP